MLIKNTNPDYGLNEIESAIFCIENIATSLNKDSVETYDILKTSGILDEYILPCYDVLHTQGKEYIVNDITELMKRKGVEERGKYLKR
ncbi:MAG: DUF3791 domain-containing protein [Catonella sp.]